MEKMQMFSNKNFSKKITRISFVLSIFVIYIHTGSLQYYGWENDGFENSAWIIQRIIGTGFGSLAVPTFFMISGFLFFRSVNVNEKNIRNVIFKKIKKRVNTLLIPYLMWCFFGTLFYMVVPHIPIANAFMNGSAIDINVKNLIFGTLFHEAYYPFWYLATLIILVLLTPLFALVLKNKIMSFVFLVILCVGAVFDIVFPEITCQSSFFYFLGCYLSVYFRGYFEKTYSCNEKIIAFILLGVSLISRSFLSIEVLNKFLLYLSPILVWISSDVFTWKITNFQKQSFFIYASHVILVTCVNKFLLSMVSINQISVSMVYIVSPIITLGVIYSLYKIFIWKFDGFYSLICGNRK